MTTFAISTLGCKVNTYESESYVQSLRELGYTEVAFKEKADVYIINTCAVTNVASGKSRQRISQAHRQNENALICVVGCYVQTQPEDLQEKGYIDILIGSSGKKQLPHLIQKGLEDKIPQLYIQDVRKEAEFEALPMDRFSHQTRAFLKIQDGCNQFCSYCIIPYARGRERSLDADEVIAAAQTLMEHHKEIVLSGIHTGRYGNDKGTTLAALIQRLLQEVPALQRIRISSIEITEISDELLDLFQDKRMARHLHIPIQSGSDAVLKRMGRPYTKADFLQRIAEIRAKIGDISISTDVITGFSNESDIEFEETKQTLQQAAFSFLHVFPFSLKSGTKAESMGDDVMPKVKKQRTHELTELSSDLYQKFQTQLIGTIQEVLVETTKNGISFGHTSEYVPVKIHQELPLNQMAEIKIISAEDQQCVGIPQEVIA